MGSYEVMETLRSRAASALDQLWDLSQSEDTTQPERIKMLQWFVAMGVGTPRQMTEASAAPQGCGVVILPDVMQVESPPPYTT